MENTCRVVKIITPKKYLLNGLWFGRQSPKKAIVFIHGLTGNVFSGHKLVVPLVSKDIAVVTFSNRGHGKISKVKKIDKRRKKGYVSEKMGEAHEVFTECVDDIQGVVNFIRSKGIKDIYLVGHSTGCHKSIYFLSKRGKQKFIKGVALLCPVSDYSAIGKFINSKNLKRAVDEARKLVEQGKPHVLLPTNIWPHYHDAQRFLSLYTPDSKEEIFSYVQPKKLPTTLRKVKIPVLVVYAGGDEYGDRPMGKIAKWYRENSKSKDLTISIIDNAPHNFSRSEHKVFQQIGLWLKKR